MKPTGMLKKNFSILFRPDMKSVNLIAICIITALLTGCSGDKLPEAKVRLDDGVVQGTVEQGTAIFKGIPFAAPPVGKLRWQAPQPVIPWQGTLNAFEYAPSAIQADAPWMGEIPTSEDCLYLNVWTPAKSAGEKLPVMVWIYGGGFAMGSASTPVNSGENIAKNGVILVSLTYRVGALGFLAHPELSAESENKVSGNYGLLDQIAGLKWVQNNIEAFGGDPSRVTIFGESAGGMSVSMLCASPLAKGLFSGAISQSGGSFNPVAGSSGLGDYMPSLKGAEASGLEFAGRMGAVSLEEMRALAPEKMISDPMSQMGGFWPVVDGYVITGDQYMLYEAGNYNDVNVIIGTNSDEGSLFVQPAEPLQYREYLKTRFGELADRAYELYPDNDKIEVYHSLSDIFRETIFAWPSYSWARLQSKTGKSRVYAYYFDQFRPEPLYPDGPVQKGAAHASEIAYVFGHLTQDPIASPTTEELSLSETMLKYWTNFAKTGNPNGEGLPEWPVFRDEGKNVMYLKGQAPEPVEIPNLEKILFIDEYFKRLREASDSL